MRGNQVIEVEFYPPQSAVSGPQIDPEWAEVIEDIKRAEKAQAEQVKYHSA